MLPQLPRTPPSGRLPAGRQTGTAPGSLSARERRPIPAQPAPTDLPGRSQPGPLPQRRGDAADLSTFSTKAQSRTGRGSRRRPFRLVHTGLRVVAVRMWVLAAVLALGLTAACGSAGGAAGADGSPVPLAGSGDTRLLRGVCPDRIVVQSNWFPTADVGVLYQLLGGRYQVDAARKRVSGPLVAGGWTPG
jgi:hypothetical protein